MDSSDLTFNESYREDIGSPDGLAMRLRLVRPSDKEKLLQGFSQLSPQSRYLRFFATKSGLTARELRYFTETDSLDHVALGALERHPDGSEGQGLGIGRFIRDSANPTTAEVAITVVDTMQRRGIGRLLLERLVAAAEERGIERFRFECLAQNRDVQKLLRAVCGPVEMVAHGDVMVATAALPRRRTAKDIRPGAYSTSLHELLSTAALKTIDIQLALVLDALNRTLDAGRAGIGLRLQS
jgi:GNAT superfamily N-acetyltransferase